MYIYCALQYNTFHHVIRQIYRVVFFLQFKSHRGDGRAFTLRSLLNITSCVYVQFETNTNSTMTTQPYRRYFKNIELNFNVNLMVLGQSLNTCATIELYHEHGVRIDRLVIRTGRTWLAIRGVIQKRVDQVCGCTPFF